MITPFLSDPSKSVDWQALDLLTDWYINSGCAGLFAVCLSSEMFQLSNEERVEIARRVAERAGGRVPVVAGATFGGRLEEQAELMKETGKHVDAVVIITNQICRMDESDEVWKDSVRALMDMTGDLPLGLYETPEPRVRALTPEMLAWCAGSGRFLFHKDTSVETDVMLRKLAAVRSLPHNNMKFFTAKIQFLSTVLEHGGNGFSGVIANFFPWLPVWLCGNQQAPEEERRGVQQLLSVADRVIAHKYPTSAKLYLARQLNVPILPESRVHSVSFTDQDAFSLDSLHGTVAKLCRELSIEPTDPMQLD
jgi:4-hydroxy-tetrahydrodipicolinate synthase